MHNFDKTKPEEISCFFIGNSHDFSDTLLNLVRVSFDETTFYRLASIEDLLNLPIKRPDRIRSIILNQSMAETLKAQHVSLLTRFPNAVVALAYRRADLAQRMLGELRACQPQMDISFLPMNRDVDCWLALVRLLICGENYIPSELHSPVQLSALSSEVAVPDPKALKSSVVQEALKLPDPSLKSKTEGLTNREIQVLTCVAEGKQNKIIADRLGLSEHTVKLHIHHVISKLGVNNRTEAAVWFLDQAKTEVRP